MERKFYWKRTSYSFDCWYPTQSGDPYKPTEVWTKKGCNCYMPPKSTNNLDMKVDCPVTGGDQCLCNIELTMPLSTIGFGEGKSFDADDLPAGFESDLQDCGVRPYTSGDDTTYGPISKEVAECLNTGICDCESNVGAALIDSVMSGLFIQPQYSGIIMKCVDEKGEETP